MSNNKPVKKGTTAGKIGPAVDKARTVAQRLLWDQDETALPFWKVVPLHILRIGYAVGRELASDQLTLRAMSLVYTTLLSLVPLLAISFSILKGFGVHNQVEPMLLSVLEPLGDKGAEIAQQIIGFVDNVKVGVLGFVGFALLFYTVVSLMQKIERSFNFIWRVTRERTLSQRFRDYLSVVMIGPALVFSSIGLTTTVTQTSLMNQLAAIQPFGWILEIATALVPFFMIIVAFTFIYVFMPNTSVRLRSAIVGATVAGISWNAMGWVFAAFIVSSAKYAAIYSTFATLIVFLIWLYIGWLILLTGATIAFYHQNPTMIAAGREPLRLSNMVKEKLTLLVAGLIGRRFEDGGAPWTLGALTERLRVPSEAAELATEALEGAGILTRTAGEPGGYVPARPLDQVAVLEILEAVCAADEGRHISAGRLAGDTAADGVMNRVRAAREGALSGASWKDLTSSPDLSGA